MIDFGCPLHVFYRFYVVRLLLFIVTCASVFACSSHKRLVHTVPFFIYHDDVSLNRWHHSLTNPKEAKLNVTIQLRYNWVCFHI